MWSNEDRDTHIGNANQLLIRRSKLDVKIILRESSESSKYELFQRLNTGGSHLSGQELRNVILIAVNPDAYQWIAELAEEPDFLTSVALSERSIDRQEHLELVTRFLVFRKMEAEDLRSVGDIGEFLNDAIVEFAQSKNFPVKQQVEEAAFRFTFEQFANSLAEHSFHKYDHQKGRHLGGFSISAFEPMALGLGYNYELYQDSGGQVPDIAEVSKKLWKDEVFLRYSGNGVRAASRIPANIPIGPKDFCAMPIRAMEQLSRFLESQLAWRKRELTTLKLAVSRSRRHEQAVFLRAAVCLLYAHWEGFIKEAATAYISYVATRGLHYRDLAPNFVALGLQSAIKQAGQSDSPLLHTELVIKMTSGQSDNAALSWRNAVNARSNLNSKVLTEILCRVGVDDTAYRFKETHN